MNVRCFFSSLEIYYYYYKLLFSIWCFIINTVVSLNLLKAMTKTKHNIRIKIIYKFTYKNEKHKYDCIVVDSHQRDISIIISYI